MAGGSTPHLWFCTDFDPYPQPNNLWNWEEDTGLRTQLGPPPGGGGVLVRPLALAADAGGGRARGRHRVRSHFRFRHRGSEYVSKYGMKWMSGSKKRQCDRALGRHRTGLTRRARRPRRGAAERWLYGGSGGPTPERPRADRRRAAVRLRAAMDESVVVPLRPAWVY